MDCIKVGDIVKCKSHESDLYFKVADVNTGEDGIEMALLKGIDHRLLLKCPVEDLVRIITFEEVDNYWQTIFAKNVGQVKRVLSRHQQEHAANIARALGGGKGNGEDI